MKKAVLISCFDWYKKRLEPIRELLVSRNYDVTVLTSDFDHIKKTEIVERHPECTYIHVPSYKKNISLNRVKSHLFFGKHVNNALNKLHPDVVYLLLPPNNIARYCSQYRKENPDSKLVIDIIDLWPESMPIGLAKRTPLAWLWKKWRDDVLKIADYVFTECNFYQEKLSGVLKPEKTSTLYLFKEQSEEESQLVQTIINNKVVNDEVRFAYLGSMNSIIDIDGICNVLKAFVDSGKKCVLHAIGDGASREKFEMSVRNAGCEAHFYGPIFNEIEKIKILAPCDFALNMMKQSVSVGLTIKSIDYLSYGLPLINNIKGDTTDLVEKEKMGINIGKDEVQNTSLVSRKELLRLYNLYFSKKAFLKNVLCGFEKSLSMNIKQENIGGI